MADLPDRAALSKLSHAPTTRCPDADWRSEQQSYFSMAWARRLVSCV